MTAVQIINLHLRMKTNNMGLGFIYTITCTELINSSHVMTIHR